jgi:8-oxo-dGTP diphosphatase
MGKVIPIVVGVVIRDNKILLLQRKNEPYIGYWAFPGGKIEPHEHVREAAMREIQEETGIATTFESYDGFVSEIVEENNAVLYHFLIHICRLNPLSSSITSTHEGEVAWFNLDELDTLHIVHSDLLMIKQMVLSKTKQYYECKVEKKKGDYFLQYFR